MRHERITRDAEGCLAGPWDSDLAVSVGFAKRGMDALIIEPGEAHTFLDSSEDFLHFVIHTPGLAGDTPGDEKQPVTRSRLGL